MKITPPPLSLSLGLCRSAGGRDPRETRNQPLGPSHLFLCSSSSALRLIALLIFPSTGNEERLGKKKKHGTNFLNPIDLLRQIFHWEFKREEEEPPPHLHQFSRRPLPFPFQLEAIFPPIPDSVPRYTSG